MLAPFWPIKYFGKKIEVDQKMEKILKKQNITLGHKKWPDQRIRAPATWEGGGLGELLFLGPLAKSSLEKELIAGKTFI